jgi:hypothetical protein
MDAREAVDVENDAGVDDVCVDVDVVVGVI